MIEHVSLGDIVIPAENERAGGREFTVLSITSSAGLVPQTSIFKKTVASRDISGYKVVYPNQLVVGIHVDEGALGFSGPNQTGIVSPAYTIWKLKDPDNVYIPYLDRFVRSSQARAHFVSNYRETAERRGKITHDQFLALEVPFPTLPEQRRIAAILDKADALRTKRREALAQLDRLAQSIFVEMFGDPVGNPKSWQTSNLGGLVRKMGSGATPTGGDAAYKPSGISLIRSMNVRDGQFVRRNLAFIDERQAQKLQNVVVEAGDVLLNITGASVARVCRAPADVLPARVNQHVMIIRPSDELKPQFLERMLLNTSMKSHLLKVGGAGATREAITKTEAEGLSVIVPPKNAQDEFTRRMEKVTKLVASCEASWSGLEILFGALQHRAFAGEL